MLDGLSDSLLGVIDDAPRYTEFDKNVIGHGAIEAILAHELNNLGIGIHPSQLSCGFEVID